MSYYSIDAILTDAQKLPCTFTLPIPGLGHLEENPGGDITPHTPLPLPLWLAELLCVQRTSSSSSGSPILTIDLPPLLSVRVLNALRADPLSVDLRQQARYFYAFATRVLELFEEEDVVDVLEMSWKRRSKGVGDVAHASSGSAGGGGEREMFLRGLEEGERGLFRAAHDSSKAMKVWMGELRGKK